jgi:hypothetical protein
MNRTIGSIILNTTFCLTMAVLIAACAQKPVCAADSCSKDPKEFGRVDEALKNFDLTNWVKAKLQHMVDVDQYMRKFMMNVPFEKGFTDAEKEYFHKVSTPRFKKIDDENTAELKSLLKSHRWFTISKFGKVTDNNAWLLVQHADDQPEFQKEVLAILESLYRSKETKPQNYAYLFDRIAASFSDVKLRKFQRYGTQGSCTGPGTWAPLPMEEPASVDVRRAEVGLGPMAEYIAMFKDICH